jgi:hypothetical protein
MDGPTLVRDLTLPAHSAASVAQVTAIAWEALTPDDYQKAVTLRSLLVDKGASVPPLLGGRPEKPVTWTLFKTKLQAMAASANDISLVLPTGPPFAWEGVKHADLTREVYEASCRAYLYRA